MKDEKQQITDDTVELSSITIINSSKKIFTINDVYFYVSLSFSENKDNNFIHSWYVTSFINDILILQTTYSLYPLEIALEHHLRELLGLPFINTHQLSEYFKAYVYKENSGATSRGHYFYKQIVSDVYRKDEVKVLNSINDKRIHDYITSIIIPSSNSRWREKDYMNVFIQEIIQFNGRNKYH
jgi:hypothetical protein